MCFVVLLCIVIFVLIALFVFGSYKVQQWKDVNEYDFKHGTMYRFEPGYVPKNALDSSC
jgi:hypothetical protein